eukprot:m.4259 g.4259  ORF g.4259 m.4259 type:complete len:733 (-) comp2944_c0_seq1:63-2261(-)
MSSLPMVLFLCLLHPSHGAVQILKEGLYYVDPSAATSYDDLLEAQTLARRHGPGAEVRIGPGRIELMNPLTFGPADEGVTYKGAGASLTSLSGGTQVNASWSVSQHLRIPNHDGNVFATNLYSNPRLNASLIGNTCPNFGDNSPRLHLYYKGTPQWLARWPNRPASPASGNWSTLRDGGKINGMKYFCYDYDNETSHIDMNSADRYSLATPEEEKEICFHGFWRYSWRSEWAPLSYCNATNHCCFSTTIVGAAAGQAAKGTFYGFGWAGDLDTAGEYVLNVTSGDLHLWPLEQQAEGVLPARSPPVPLNPPGVLPGPEDLIASVLNEAILINFTSNVLLADFTVEHVRGTAINVQNSTNCTIAGVTVARAGVDGVHVFGGSGVSITRSNFTNLGAKGVSLLGGDRETLTPSNHSVDNSRFWRHSMWTYCYTPSVQLSGVGAVVRKSLAYDLPHQFVSYGGNNHLIELNIVHDTIRMSYDSGAIYSDRHPTYRGTHIKNNLFYRLGNFSIPGMPTIGATSKIQQAVYVDDFLSQVVVEGNIFAGMMNGFFSHNGRNHTLVNNLFVNTSCPVAYSGQSSWGTLNETFKAEIFSFPYTTPPWSTQYPDLAHIFSNGNKSNMLPALPRFISTIRNGVMNVVNTGSEYTPNMDSFWYIEHGIQFLNTSNCSGCTSDSWGAPESTCQGCFTTYNNSVDNIGFTSQDPYATLDFSLSPSSPLWKLGWKRIPQEQMGPDA